MIRSPSLPAWKRPPVGRGGSHRARRLAEARGRLKTAFQRRDLPGTGRLERRGGVASRTLPGQGPRTAENVFPATQPA